MNGQSLIHHGIKGMKWGVVRSEAQLRAVRGAKTPSEKKASKKGGLFKKKKKVTRTQETVEEKNSIRNMTDEELKRLVQRLNLEKQYRDLNPPRVSAGKKFVDKVMKDVVSPALVNTSKKALESLLTEAINSAAKNAASKKKK